MITLGLDPSLTDFGWCVFDSSATGIDRIVAKGRFKTEAGDLFVSRYMAQRERVKSLFTTYPQIEAVGVESPPFGALWSEGLYGLFVFVNEAIYTARKDVIHFDPATVKMLAKGDPSKRKGSMTKGDMVAAAKADTGIARINHNEADAYLIAKASARFWLNLRGELDDKLLTPAERQAFIEERTLKKGPRAGEVEKTGAKFKEGSRFFRFSQISG